jgi:hypothetical protein
LDKPSLEQCVTDRHMAGDRDDRERINRARATAEDLFRPKPSAAPAVLRAAADPDPAGSADQQLPRQPRIIPILPAAPTNTANAEPPAEPKPEARQIRASQYGRVRALLNYGMTREQVADLYTVPVSEIERIISRSGSRNRL